MARDRTEVAAGADNHGRLERVVHDPLVTQAAERCYGRAVPHDRARPTEQIVIELAPPDGIADDARVSGLDQSSAHEAGAESGDLLKRQPGRAVGLRVQVQELEDFRCEPAGAHLVAWESSAIHDDDVPSGVDEDAGTGRPRRTSADNQRIAVEQGGTRVPPYRLSRVQKGGRASAGAKTTWKSCSQPVAKAASEPAR